MILRRLWIGLGTFGCCVFLTGSSKGSPIVAVIDTGVDEKHPSLQGALWTNPGETGLDQNGNDKRINGIDDDRNGFVDDVHGWNFVNNSPVLTDRHGHGTHIAGIIANVSPDQPAQFDGPRLMILKYFDPGTSETENLRNSVRAIHYAIRMKAQIINYSGGGSGENTSEKRAIDLAQKHGILFVAAAGNEHSNSDLKSYFPADYGLPNILSVAALDDNGDLIPASNYGRKTVHIGAAGHRVLSTVPGGWGRMTGTSQAAAMATASAVKLLQQKPGLRTPVEMIGALIRQGRREPGLKDKTRDQVRVSPTLFDKI